MNDTPAHIHQLQLAIFNKMTDGERISICLDMMEEGRDQLKANIKRKHPDWSEADIAVATFELLYRDDFTPEKLAHISASIRAYHLRNL